MQAPPFIFRRTDDNGTAQYSGYAVDVWNEIASTLNLTYYFTEPFDQEFGVLLENGTWTGIVGMVVSGVTRREALLSSLFLPLGLFDLL